uniref:Putative tyrosine/serine phosphatase NikL-like protein n=1 Tax=Prochloron didemni P3-Solomon TaxID=910458 RepID=G0XS80_PRODI|nr:putative tyrosine/serine phosphatase NikL-like protein [Prochloron didemni P3-Solomon]
MRKTRRIKLTSAINLRDLGSLQTMRKGFLPTGQVFRSGSLSKVNLEDTRWICNTKLFRTYIDLRTPKELLRDGKPDLLIANGINWLSIPMDSRESFKLITKQKKPKPSDYLDCYCQMLKLVSLPLRTLLELIADGSGLPIVFGCTAGKDRTGIIAALLLSALNIPERYICADYALSTRCLRQNLEWFRPHWENKGISAIEYARRLEARPATMSGFLLSCKKSYGSMKNLFDSLGIYTELISTAKNSLSKFTVNCL